MFPNSFVTVIDSLTHYGLQQLRNNMDHMFLMMSFNVNYWPAEKQKDLFLLTHPTVVVVAVWPKGDDIRTQVFQSRTRIKNVFLIAGSGLMKTHENATKRIPLTPVKIPSRNSEVWLHLQLREPIQCHKSVYDWPTHLPVCELVSSGRVVVFFF